MFARMNSLHDGSQSATASSLIFTGISSAICIRLKKPASIPEQPLTTVNGLLISYIGINGIIVEGRYLEKMKMPKGPDWPSKRQVRQGEAGLEKQWRESLGVDQRPQPNVLLP